MTDRGVAAYSILGLVESQLTPAHRELWKYFQLSHENPSDLERLLAVEMLDYSVSLLQKVATGQIKPESTLRPIDQDKQASPGPLAS